MKLKVFQIILNVELGSLYHQTKCERNRSVNVCTQANVKVLLVLSFLFLFVVVCLFCFVCIKSHK